jgi:hypothetical protein
MSLVMRLVMYAILLLAIIGGIYGTIILLAICWLLSPILALIVLVLTIYVVYTVIVEWKDQKEERKRYFRKRSVTQDLSTIVTAIIGSIGATVIIMVVFAGMIAIAYVLHIYLGISWMKIAIGAVVGFFVVRVLPAWWGIIIGLVIFVLIVM